MFQQSKQSAGTPKSFYLDRSGNMSTSSSCLSSSNGSVGVVGSVLAGGNNGNAVRKEILPLKSKQQNVFVQRLEHKPKKVEVPVTTLELKKKEKAKLEKNNVVNLVYRKPVGLRDINMSIPSIISTGKRLRRTESPSSSGYSTDSLMIMEQQENDYVFAAMIDNAFSNQYQSDKPIMSFDLGMLSSHPVWAPANNLYM